MASRNSSIDPLRGPRGKRTRTYRSWCEMRQRCMNPRSKNYPRYGGRGINICPEWDSFEKFYDDMGKCPPAHSIDRINNNSGYSKENCRWATALEQAQNTRSVILLTFEGETHCVREWARRIGIWNNALRERLKRGWPLEKALAKAK